MYGCRDWKGLGRVRLGGLPTFKFEVKRNTKMEETSAKEFKISFIKFLTAKWLRPKDDGRYSVGRTDYFWAKANAIHFVP